MLGGCALLGRCAGAAPETVDPADYTAFWLWPGVPASPALAKAHEVFLLDSELSRDGHMRVLRPEVPRLRRTPVWLVVRVETLDWSPQVEAAVLARLERWRGAGGTVAGLQVDFDATTRHLDRYAAFLRELRQRLPARYKLSITGLLDWSANGDPAALASLRGVVDEVVLQTYQARTTIPGYAAYFRTIAALPLPFRIGLVEGGEWHAPPQLAAAPNFRGYVVFLLKPRGPADRGRQLSH